MNNNSQVDGGQWELRHTVWLGHDMGGMAVHKMGAMEAHSLHHH